ncbi:GAF domain-containing sensor histidine kinase [Marinilabilia sp.]
MEFAEAATLVGNHKQMNELIHEVYNTTENVLQKAKLHEIKTMSLIAQNKQQEAVKETIFLLKLLGERFPSKPGVPQMLIQLFKTRLNLKKYNLAKPDTLQPMSNPLKIAAMRNMANIISVLYRTDPNLFALLVFKLVNLTLKYGVAPISPVGFITFGLLTNVIFKKLDKGYELGKAGMKLFKRLDANKHWPQAYYIYNVGITPWKERLEKVCDNLYDAYLKAGEAGDYEYMMSAAAAGAHYRFRAGFELNELINTTKKHKQSISNVYEKISSSQFDVLLQMFTNFVVPKEKPEELIGELYNEKKMIEYHKKDNDETSLIMIYLDKLTLAYYFGRYEEALKIIESAKKYTKGVSGLLMEANYCFFETLTLLANYNNTCPLKKRKFRKRIAKNLKKMQTWALNAPMNFSCKAKLMEAEKESIIGNNLKSGTLYEEAISGSIKNQFIHETALGNELAGNHWARQKNKRVSEFYIKEAFRLYNLWGANAKLEDLKKRYKEIVNLEHDKIQAIINHESYRSSKYSISIDIETLIDASKTILKEWDYGELINNTLKVLIEHAGAQKGLLLLTKNHKDEEKLFIEARGWVKQDKILTRIDEKEMNKAILPISVVNAAYKTQETIILHNANIEGSYVHDNYIKENEVKSIIALPITKQKEAIGILYLENNLDTNVFNQSRVNLLSILCTQLAISLENLSLYKKIDQKVRQRTVEVIKQKEKVEMQASELKEINNKLEASNATKDKLFSIIGHDLRNPFNIILGQVSLLKEGIENIAQDIIKTSACFIENASKSAYQLLQNLLAWAMTQTKQVKLYTKTISLHALVNREVEMLVNMAETKNIDLKNLTKEEIEILADEETVSTVIRNLISNAIKFTEKDGQITINAKENKSEVEITVKDNGVGIKEENIAKIFGSEETLSTRGTESEKGIGIGLKICKEFVEQNNGKIWVESEYGEGSKFIFTLPLA